METEQLKSVLQVFKVKVAELNLDYAIEALEAVYKAKEDEKKARKAQADAEAAKADAESKAKDAKVSYETYVKAMTDARAEAARVLAGVK
jgi:hypothetical protein